ncbi:MAG: hypothetical protein JOZ73_13290 [Solirubrobacterales bacterium]|nr:hypothetical protein [Solirubrobacterales bacterium]
MSSSLLPRGYLTTEWWTTIVAGALSAVLALVHVSGSSATHIVAVATPALLAAVYAIVRTMHKSALAATLRDAFPQAGATTQQALEQQAQQGLPVTAVTQTDAEFSFAGIEAANG